MTSFTPTTKLPVFFYIYSTFAIGSLFYSILKSFAPLFFALKLLTTNVFYFFTSSSFCLTFYTTILSATPPSLFEDLVALGTLYLPPLVPEGYSLYLPPIYNNYFYLLVKSPFSFDSLLLI